MDLCGEMHIPEIECSPSPKTRVAMGEAHSTDIAWAIAEGERSQNMGGGVVFMDWIIS